MPSVAENIITRFEKISSARGNQESLWDMWLRLAMPQAARIRGDSMQGESRGGADVFDGTAAYGRIICANGLYGELSNPATKWARFRFSNPEVMESFEARDWLQDCQDILFETLTANNFYTTLNQFYHPFVTLGSGAIYTEQNDTEGGCDYYALPMQGNYFLRNSRRVIDTWYRLIKLTARQAVQEFGEENVGTKVREMSQKEPETEFEYIHEVRPRAERDVTKSDKLNMAFSSIYVERDTKTLVREGGYPDFPAPLADWYLYSGDEYGRGPIAEAFAEIAGLNTMRRQYLERGEAVLRPAMLIDARLKGKFRMTPGSKMYVSDMNLENAYREVLSAARFDIPKELIEDVRNTINKFMMVDMFLMLQTLSAQGKIELATQVRELSAERTVLLGPVVGSLTNSLLGPTLVTAFNIMYNSGQFPAPPPEVIGQSWKIEYVSPLALAMQAYVTKASDDMLAYAAQMAELYPQGLDNFKIDQIFRKRAEHAGMDLDDLRSPEEVEAIREERRQVIQAEQEKQDAERLVQAGAQAQGAIQKTGVTTK